MNLHTVPFKSKLTVRCKCRFSMQFAILNSCANRELRTSYRESSCRFLQQPIIESTCREQITRNKTLLIDYKQRDCSGLISRAGIKNRDTKIENRVSILDSILDSRKDRESSVNLLLNGTVCFLVVGGGYGFCSDRRIRQGIVIRGDWL